MQAQKKAPEFMTDELLDLLAARFEAQRIELLCGITFETYVEHHEHYDAVVVHLVRGGACRREGSFLVMTGGAS